MKDKIQPNQKTGLTPPVAKKIAQKTTIHDQTRQDDYFWLREKENPEVIAYLEAENVYTEAMTEHLKPLQETLYKEMIGRIRETDLDVPKKHGPYFYYTRTEEGKNYSIYCRKKGSLDAKEEILLDGNQLAEGKSYFRLGSFSVSEDHTLLAYSADFDGSEQYDIFFKDLVSGKMVDVVIPQTAGKIVWSNDNRFIFYSTLDETRRPCRLHRHKLGTSVLDDIIVHEEKDGAYFLYPYKSESLKYIFIYLGSKVTTEYYYLEADNPEGDFKLFAPRQQGEEYSVSHYGDHFYILTNKDALNFKVLKTPLTDTPRTNWSDFMPHDPGILLNHLEVFKDYLVIYCRRDGYKAIQIYHFESGTSHFVQFPEPVFTYWLMDNPEYDSTLLRITYSSLITPRTVYDYDMADKTLIFKKEYEVLGGYDKSEYVTKRLEAVAKDGVTIPISIAYKKGVEINGNNPAYLYGYGSYGSSMDPYFSTARLSLLDRGFVFAMAHIRGGAEMGRQWYEDGKFLNKKNTFTDFIACAEHLVNQRYTNTDKLVIAGGSAGGLLMGAVMNLRPDLFKAVVASVPFVDVINTMLDDTIPLTVVEYEEWGNPNDKTYFDYMLSYSPYDNVEAKNYPNILITAGLNDPRVQYWEPAKWTAKLRETKTDNNTLLLKTNMGAGHGGASGRYEALKELAFEYAFVIDKAGNT